MSKVTTETPRRKEFKITLKIISIVLFAGLLVTGCAIREKSEANSLVGAWKGKVQFKSGAFSGVKDLEFMYVFNAGGTMTESSNYDGAPPVPPAYGVWRNIGPKQFEARYQFFITKPPANFDDLTKGGGWLPVGLGALTEKITLGDDGNSFESTVRYETIDQAGKPIESAGEGEASARRMDW